MITYKEKKYSFEEIEKKILEDDFTEEKEFIIEAIRSCFFTEDGLTVVDEDGITIMVNGAHGKIMNMEGNEIVGKHVNDLVVKGTIQKSASAVVFETKKQETIIQNLSNGKTILVTATPLYDEKRHIYRIINNLRDVPILNELYEERLKQQAIIDSYRSNLQRRTSVEKEGLIAESNGMRNVIKFAERVAANESNVLILGESGVGKGMIARLIHSLSKRQDKPLMSINCGAIPEQLLESELFGYVPGAFTGASTKGKLGLFEVADGGSLFLDEIGELPLSLQPKILTFLETGEIIKVGSTQPQTVDCRIIAATNKNLKEMVKEGAFREDLYYRLSVIPIEIPPLRKRREDIIPMIILFLKEINQKNNCSKIINSELLHTMEAADWKGNARQLKNMVERLVVLSANREITVKDLPREEGFAKGKQAIAGELPVSLPQIICQVEDEYIEKAMKQGGSIRKAANLLDISPTALFRRINRKE